MVIFFNSFQKYRSYLFEANDKSFTELNEVVEDVEICIRIAIDKDIVYNKLEVHMLRDLETD